MSNEKEFDPEPKKETAAVIQKCLEGKGFVLFVGILIDKKDKDGNFILNFHYVRNHYGFEDLPRAITAFREHCRKDAMSIMDT